MIELKAVNYFCEKFHHIHIHLKLDYELGLKIY